ncbi:MAG: immune inhibitor A [Chloroflexota bacterium]
MKKRILSIALLLVALTVIFSVVAYAAPDPGNNAADGVSAPRVDDRVDPLTREQRALHDAAMESLAYGKAYGKTHEVARGQYVELEREGEDPVWTVLGEFNGEETTCEYEYPWGVETWSCTNPAHNMIAEPNRKFDNSTLWVDDFSRDYYLDLLFAEGEDVNSMRQFYIENSSNRYAVYGDVTDWATVPNDACTYDDDIAHPDGGNAVWYFLRDTVNAWYDDQIADGKTPEEINDYLSQFDVWDRYDWDMDGNFDEPDGYIDHMNFLHAGEGNEAGGGELGDCAIWSHSWFAFSNLVGIAGPSPDFLIGGLQIGDSDFWLNKYIINPENGGVGVFVHEYGHDLGLPDLYDYTGENSTGFWTVMSSGSWLSQNPYDIGSEPNHFGVWEKFQLGWLNYEVAYAGWKSEHKLGPAETNTKQAQGLFVVLPDKPVTEQIAEPAEGSHFYYSGSGNNLDNWMTKSVTLPAGATLAAQANLQIELDWDYAYLVVSSDGGATWDEVETNLSTDFDPNGQNFGHGMTGNTYGWVDLTADLSDYEGDVMIGFRYWTDVAAVEPGFMVDAIEISGQPFDGAEEDAGWVFDGFRVTTGTESAYYFNAYVAEFRQYRGYDAGLSMAYNFGWVGVPDYGNYVERFPYQDGLLVSYWDSSFPNNNVGANCGAGRCGGLLLPVDAHPELMYDAFGDIWRNRIQTYDATFGLEPTDAITLHKYGEPSEHPSLPAVPIFDDMNSYYDEANPMGSVMVPHTGTQIRVKSVSAHGSFMQVEVRPSK